MILECLLIHYFNEQILLFMYMLAYIKSSAYETFQAGSTFKPMESVW